MRAFKAIIREASLATILAVTITACKQEPLVPETPDKPEVPTLSFGGGSSPSFQIGSSSGTTTLSFKASSSWTVKIENGTRADDSWCTVIPMSGDAGDASISISVDENTGIEDRSCTVDILCNGSIAGTIPVVQKGSTEAETERRFLKEFYRELNGDGWKNNAGWLTEKPVGEWYGVKTDAEGNVLGIDLRENGLTGHIPASITKLTKLQSLILKHNGITSASVDNPVPEIWKETWGDILYANKVTLDSFKELGVGLPERILTLIPKKVSSYIVLWDPRKGDKTDQEYDAYMDSLDYFRGIAAAGISVVGICTGIPEQELKDSVSKKEIPWENVILDAPWPIHDYPDVGWVKIDDSGDIDDTNLLEKTGKQPQEPKLPWVSVTSNDLDLKSPSIAVRGLDQIFQILYGPGPGHWEVEYSTSTSWMKIIGNDLVVNGNPSLFYRMNRVRVKIYYNGLLLKRASATVFQPGVYFQVLSDSNEKDFSMMKDWDLSDAKTTALGFTPYPDSRVLALKTNADGLFDPLQGPASPYVVTGDGFRTEGAIPDVSAQIQSDTLVINHAYPSNRSTDFRTCFLTYYPFVYTIEDWDQLAIYQHLIENNVGEFVYHMAACVQTAIRMYTEYDSYLAEAIATPYAEIPGYNLAEVYDNLTLKHKVSDKIKVSSNVDWRIKSVSLADEAWQYTVSGAEDMVDCDGKTFRDEAFRLFVNDYLKNKVNDSRNGSIYRVQDYTPRRSTRLRAEVNLRDGLPPLTVDLTEITQVGLPFMYFTGWEAPDCPQGEYEFNGHLYKYKTDYTVFFAWDMDDLTRYFVGYPELDAWAQSTEGETYYNSGWGWRNLANNSSSYSSSVYWDADFDLSFDMRMRLSTGVEVYSADRMDVHARESSSGNRSRSHKKRSMLLEKPLEEYCRPVSLKQIPKPVAPRVPVTDRIYPLSKDGMESPYLLGRKRNLLDYHGKP